MRMDKAKAAPAKVKGGVPALLGRTWNSIPADSKSEYRIPENKKNTENKTQNRGCRNTLEFGLVVVGWNWSLGNQLLANNDWLAPTAIHCNAIKQDCAVLLLFRRWSMSSLWISVVTDSLLPSHKCHLATATNCQGNHPNQPKKCKKRLEARGDDTNRHFFILINRSSYFFFFPQVVSPDTTESNCHIGCQCPSWPMTLDTLNWHHWCCYWGVVRNLCVYLTALTIFSLHLDFLLVTGKASLRPL